MARKKPSSSVSPIAIGNCQVVVKAKNFNAETNLNSLQISLSRNSNIIISVVEDALVKDRDNLYPPSFGENGNYYFELVNPKDSDVQSKALLQEILTLYMKELPSMNYAANTGKKSTFLEKCVSNGKYCTLVLKSKSEEVVAAISFQIIPADTQYAEVPVAAVSSVYQHKGIGHFTYLEMRKRLQRVGVHSIYCWADMESEGFWLKQGFVSVGQVDTKGRARRLTIRADIRRTLCFPGGSTLMIAHLSKEYLNDSAESLHMSSLLKPLQNQSPGAEDVLKNNHLMNSCQDLVCVDSLECINTENNLDEMRIRTDGDAGHCSCSSGAKKRTWEASHTSLKSKKVKGGHMIVCQSDNDCVSRSNKSNGCCMDVSPMPISGDKSLADQQPTSGVGSPLSNIYEDNAHDRKLVARTTNNHGCVKLTERNCYKIMLMNIADDAKKSNLAKIIEKLGGSVTSDGKVSTHVITGKVRKTLNFCTALCTGAWVVSPAWLKESFREGKFVDELPYILEDLEYELKYSADLKATVLRARASPGALLKGYKVCLAAHLQPPINALSAIVRSAGGNVIRNLNKAKDPAKTIFVASEDNIEEASTAIKKGIPTFSDEWFMNCVMKQDLDLEAPQFAESLL